MTNPKPTAEMKVLHLTLKKKWFDMILSGDKKEEYREIKPYWFRRLVYCGKDDLINEWCKDIQDKKLAARWNYDNYYYGKSFNKILFRNGYSKNAPSFEIECKGIEIGHGLIHWGAEKSKEYFVIKLGSITNHN